MIVVETLIRVVTRISMLAYARIIGWRTARSWQQRAAPELREHYSSRTGFEQRLHARWDSALNGLELLWLKAYEEGRAYNDRQRPAAAAEKDFPFDAHTRLHARACRTASEILALLRAGHADGAYGRWRTLYEITVTMFFLVEHGHAVAEAYLLHEGARAWNAAEEYQRHHKDLRYAPIPQADLDAIKARRDSLITRFGTAYGRDYGWAAHTLSQKQPTFADIERAVDLSRWRPRYRMASEGQHAGSRALWFSLGLRDGDQTLLAGPSDLGLEDPGTCTAISLAQATVALLTSRPEVRGITSAVAIQRLAGQVERRFNEIGAALDR